MLWVFCGSFGFLSNINILWYFSTCCVTKKTYSFFTLKTIKKAQNSSNRLSNPMKRLIRIANYSSLRLHEFTSSASIVRWINDGQIPKAMCVQCTSLDNTKSILILTSMSASPTAANTQHTNKHALNPFCPIWNTYNVSWCASGGVHCIVNCAKVAKIYIFRWSLAVDIVYVDFVSMISNLNPRIMCVDLSENNECRNSLNIFKSVFCSLKTTSAFAGTFKFRF